MDLSLIIDICLGAAAFKLAWSVDRTQKAMLVVQERQTVILEELTRRIEVVEKRLEEKLNE